MTDAFTHASPVYQRTLRGRVRDRSVPIETRRAPAALPDPRSFDARAVRAGFILRTIVQAAACALPVALFWWVLS